ncbi:nuclear transport factor 2 family protein [Streptomyces sp. NRRL S-350]|uniref:nuclear transport factor 2 family protein n=1 Tax=Streptomyces sp. NRRL S-350 TaxID=1463902 RepID=UPI00099B46BA|nr:nuclear transport factor 2 family protein [Streptomyces sp. NRRL S-350]
MDFMSVASAFVQHYYTSFGGGDAARKGLAGLYRPESMLTWEGAQAQGQANIAATLTRPELADIRHRVSTSDAQPAPGGGVLVSVTGVLAVDDAADKPLPFTETFDLQPIPGRPGGFFIHNQVFRLILGA